MCCRLYTMHGRGCLQSQERHGRTIGVSAVAKGNITAQTWGEEAPCGLDLTAFPESIQVLKIMNLNSVLNLSQISKSLL